MRPQDLVILIKIALNKEGNLQIKDLAKDLYISPSEVSKSLKRSEFAGLYLPTQKKVMRQALMEIIQYAVKYIYPTIPGYMTNGIPTAISHPYMTAKFEPNIKYVWQDNNAMERGLAVTPLYDGAINAAKHDEDLYLVLALIDVLRIGKNREKDISIQMLKTKLLHESSN